MKKVIHNKSIIRDMKNRKSFILITSCSIILLNLLAGCRQNTGSNPIDSNDSVFSGDTLSPPDTIITPDSVIQNKDTVQSVNTQEEAPLLSTICSLASLSVSCKDQLEWKKGFSGLTETEDSLVFGPIEDSAYQAIMEYKRLLALGAPLPGSMPKLIGEIPFSDTDFQQFLPYAVTSFITDKEKFFFLGGGYFLSHLPSDEAEVFKDPQGNREVRYACWINRNTEYILDVVRRLYPGRINISFGPPLDSYESGPIEVKGIGSLLHEFLDPVPVFFLTQSGMVPARLVSVRVKPVPQDLGCISDRPGLIFGCTKPPSCIVNRKKQLWTADLNNDGKPDLAAFSETFEGISSDTMMRITWFINSNGKWKLIDQAEELDCT